MFHEIFNPVTPRQRTWSVVLFSNVKLQNSKSIFRELQDFPILLAAFTY